MPPVRATIRILSEDDRADAVGVINESARWYAEILPPAEVPDPEMSPEQWTAESERMTWFGAFVDGQLAGVIGVEYLADVALLRHWYVLPPFQRCGVGTRLREHVEHQAAGVGRIIAGTYAANTKARSALEQAGYQLSADPDAVLDAYYDIPDDRRRSSVTYERPVVRSRKADDFHSSPEG
jgi:GNAT superfamily N-acetyltransferase